MLPVLHVLVDLRKNETAGERGIGRGAAESQGAGEMKIQKFKKYRTCRQVGRALTFQPVTFLAVDVCFDHRRVGAD